MVAYRFRSRTPSVPTPMTEKGNRWTDPPKRGKLPSPELSAPPLTLPLSVPSPKLPAVPAEPITPPIAPAHLAMGTQPPRNRGTVAAARQTIMDSGILETLIDYVMSRIELSPGQVSAAMWLGKKIVPDLATVSLPPESDDEAEDGLSLIEFRIVDPQR